MNAASQQQTIAPQGRVKSGNITIRRTKFKNLDLDKQYTRSPLMSHLLTALSASFPQGEHFFVETVRNVRDQISDPLLQADISAFIGQESMHAARMINLTNIFSLMLTISNALNHSLNKK
jgi:predicted metal-dependent hydrolase